MQAFGARILILSPHPDDEAAGACAFIARARAAGARISVLHLTTGVPAAETLWPWERGAHAGRVRRRRAEAEAAAAALGVETAGFSDRPTRALRFSMDAAYTEIDTALGALGALGADALWVPAYEGAHADHDAANVLASAFTDRLAVFEFAEYTFAGGRVRSHTFIETRGGEEVITLSPAEAAEKRRALSIYASEAGNLNYIKTGQEAIRPLAAYDYSRPPHAGRMFYQRFQWVPFRHPRIDWTTPEEVSTAAAAFLQRGQ
ncbi:MAG: PIG-L family deacetylase [Rhodospirillales bacterium]